MQKQGSEASLLFHGLICQQFLLLDPRALRFLGSNKFVQLIFARALGDRP